MVQLRVLEIWDEQGHTHYWLQKQLGGMCYRNYMNMVTCSTQSIRFETLDKLSKILNVPVGDLFVQINDMTNQTKKQNKNSKFSRM